MDTPEDPDVLAAVVAVLRAKPQLWAGDVATLFGALAGRPVAATTVLSYATKSRSGRYTGDPMPLPSYEGPGGRPGRPRWAAAQIPELVAWWRRRSGRFGDPRRDRPIP